jgi:hypothetical protein
VKINYTKNGRPFSDFEIEDFLFKNFDNKNMIDFSTENLFDAARVWFLKDLIDCVEVYFEGKFVGKIDEYGGLSEYPVGFCSFTTNCLFTIAQIADEKLGL